MKHDEMSEYKCLQEITRIANNDPSFLTILADYLDEATPEQILANLNEIFN